LRLEKVSQRFECWFKGYHNYTKINDKVSFIPFEGSQSFLSFKDA